MCADVIQGRRSFVACPWLSYSAPLALPGHIPRRWRFLVIFGAVGASWSYYIRRRWRFLVVPYSAPLALNSDLRQSLLPIDFSNDLVGFDTRAVVINAGNDH